VEIVPLENTLLFLPVMFWECSKSARLERDDGRSTDKIESAVSKPRILSGGFCGAGLLSHCP